MSIARGDDPDRLRDVVLFAPRDRRLPGLTGSSDEWCLSQWSALLSRGRGCKSRTQSKPLKIKQFLFHKLTFCALPGHHECPDLEPRLGAGAGGEGFGCGVACWIEGGETGNQDLRSSSDRHLLIVDRDNKYLYVFVHPHAYAHEDSADPDRDANADENEDADEDADGSSHRDACYLRTFLQGGLRRSIGSETGQPGRCAPGR